MWSLKIHIFSNKLLYYNSVQYSGNQFHKTECVVELDRVWISSGSSLVATSGLGFEFFWFQNSKIFRVWLLRVLRKLAQNLRVFDFSGLRENFDQNLAKMHLFVKIFYSSELDLIMFQFFGFFRIRVMAIFRDQVFSGLGKLDQALLKSKE